MKEMAVHVYEEMLYMRARGDAMHNTSQSTRSRLLWVELVMMCTLLLMGLWQIQYLRNCARRPPSAAACPRPLPPPHPHTADASAPAAPPQIFGRRS